MPRRAGSPPCSRRSWRSRRHIVCFQGFLGSTIAGVPFGGPENSLTIWKDQGETENLCDYGAAWSFMEFLAGRYGAAFVVRSTTRT